MSEDQSEFSDPFKDIGEHQGFNGGADKIAGENQPKKYSIFDKKDDSVPSGPTQEVFENEDTFDHTQVTDEIHNLFDFPQVTVLYELPEGSELYIESDHERIATKAEVESFIKPIPRRVNCISTGFHVGKMVGEGRRLEIDPEELVNEVVFVIDHNLPENSLRGYNSRPNDPIMLVFPKPEEGQGLGEKVSYTTLTYVSAHETTQKLRSDAFVEAASRYSGASDKVPMDLFWEGVVEKSVAENFDKIDPNGYLKPERYPYRKAVDMINILCDEMAIRGATDTTQEAFRILQAGVFEVGRADDMFDILERTFGDGFVAEFASLATMESGATDRSLEIPEQSEKYNELIARLRKSD